MQRWKDQDKPSPLSTSKTTQLYIQNDPNIDPYFFVFIGKSSTL